MGVSGRGASGLRFNAKAGVIYYIAVDGKNGNAGPLNLNWAYHSSGVFRFATENLDETSGIPAKAANIFGSGSGAYPGMLLYQVAETEEFGSRGGRVDPGQFNSTIHTVYNYQVPGLLVTITRVAGSSGRVTVGYSTVDGANISDHYRFDAVNDVLVPDGVNIPLNGDAPAVGDQDYAPVSGTLTFDDFEMSKTILIPILDDGGTPRPNRDFSIVLYTPQKDLLEASSVSQPRLDPVFSQALVRILDADLDPRGPSQSGQVVTNIDTVAMTTNVFTNTVYSLNSSNAILNFLKSNYRIPEDVSDYWGTTPITVYVNRSGTNTGTASIFYRVNAAFLDNVISDGNNDFPLQPGSDYATPPPAPGSPGAIIGRAPADFNGIDNGTLTWADKDFDPKPITFSINNDTITEFNEYFHISLYVVVNRVVIPVVMIN